MHAEAIRALTKLKPRAIDPTYLARQDDQPAGAVGKLSYPRIRRRTLSPPGHDEATQHQKRQDDVETVQKNATKGTITSRLKSLQERNNQPEPHAKSALAKI